MGVPFGVGRFVGSSGKPSLHSGYWEKPHLGIISRHRLPLTVCRLQRHCPSAPCLSAIVATNALFGVSCGVLFPPAPLRQRSCVATSVPEGNLSWVVPAKPDESGMTKLKSIKQKTREFRRNPKLTWARTSEILFTFTDQNTVCLIGRVPRGLGAGGASLRFACRRRRSPPLPNDGLRRWAFREGGRR